MFDQEVYNIDMADDWDDKVYVGDCPNCNSVVHIHGEHLTWDKNDGVWDYAYAITECQTCESLELIEFFSKF